MDRDVMGIDELTIDRCGWTGKLLCPTHIIAKSFEFTSWGAEAFHVQVDCEGYSVSPDS